VRGIGDACRSLGMTEQGEPLPVISGNVSFYNQSETGEPIPPSPIVACAGRVDDVGVCRSMGFKRKGSIIALLGELHSSMGGSEYAAEFGLERDGNPPRPDLEREGAMQRVLVEGIRQGHVLAAHDISHGGVLVTIAEMMLRSVPHSVGCELSFDEGFSIGADSAHELFGEYGGIAVEVAEAAWERFEEQARRSGVRIVTMGRTTAGVGMRIHLAAGMVEVPFEEIASAHSRAGKCHRLFG